MKILIHLAVVVMLGALIYSNTMRVPFVYDDEHNLEPLTNSSLNDWRCFINADYAKQLVRNGALQPNFPTRIVTFFTFALTYRLLGNSLAGYHLVNLLIHLLNGILVYCLLCLTLRTPFAKTAGEGGSSGIMAVLASLMFVSHPVQTEAVTYISQRFTSLATLFFLLSLVCYLWWRLDGESAAESLKKSTVWAFLGDRPLLYALSLFSAFMAMKSKEISFTLPLMICMYEYFFFAEGPRRRWLFLLPFLLTMLIIPLTVLAERADYVDIVNLKASLHESGPGKAILYLCTQFKVIVTYLRLLVLPVNQNLDYEYPLATGFFQLPVILSFLFLLTLFGLGTYLLVRSGRVVGRQGFGLRLVSLGIFWFFLTLSVESTLLPLQDVIFEHRLYLPSVGFFIALIALFAIIRARVGKVGGSILTITLLSLIFAWSGATYARNGVWRDQISLLEDVVSKSPGKSRSHYALGGLYQNAGRIGEAIQQYEEAIRLEPGSVDASFKLAMIYLEQGNYVAALPVLEEASRFQDACNDPQFYSALGESYLKTDRLAEAERALRLAIARDTHPEAPLRNLGEVYLKQKRFPEALAAFEEVLRVDPENSEILTTLGAIRAEQADYAGARRELQRALSMDPGNEQARQQLKRVLGSSRNRDRLPHQPD
jgi:tetratricopeptide (TPR) repeat protein